MVKQKRTDINTIELYSVWYFQELKENGFLKDYVREPETLVCAPKVKHDYLQRFKRVDDRLEELTLFPEISYTYDYKLIWNKEARYLFYDLVDKDNEESYFLHGRPLFIANYDYDHNGDEMHVTRIDVKPTAAVARFGRVQSSVTFPIKQRMLYEKDGTYIQKFIPIPMAGAGKTSAIFIKSFTPKRYIFTDGGKQLRKIKWPITDLKGYLNIRSKEINVDQPKLF